IASIVPEGTLDCKTVAVAPKGSYKNQLTGWPECRLNEWFSAREALPALVGEIATKEANEGSKGGSGGRSLAPRWQHHSKAPLSNSKVLHYTHGCRLPSQQVKVTEMSPESKANHWRKIVMSRNTLVVFLLGADGSDASPPRARSLDLRSNGSHIRNIGNERFSMSELCMAKAILVRTRSRRKGRCGSNAYEVMHNDTLVSHHPFNVWKDKAQNGWPNGGEWYVE
ncbi:uncharacterized protein EI90DRAFT_3066234, partial [Cantharellus anzutake]|uniref:uncharacterized protein n=1 Tax=Cantharellus anzutake TaxID=1750568 RepID=UPI001902F047